MTARTTQKQHLREMIMRMLERRLALDPGFCNTAVLAAARKRLSKMKLTALRNQHQTLSTTLIYLEKQRGNNKANKLKEPGK